jgi:hypothetical protein
MKEKIWKFFDDEAFKSYEEYEANQPSKVLEYYGEALEDDMNKMLEYDVISEVSSIDSYPIYLKSEFWIKLPKAKISNGYNIKVFETLYESDKSYPCKLHSLLTENRYDCLSKEDLTQKILEEIQNKRFMEKINNLLYHFYDKEEIKKLIN